MKKCFTALALLPAISSSVLGGTIVLDTFTEPLPATQLGFTRFIPPPPTFVVIADTQLYAGTEAQLPGFQGRDEHVDLDLTTVPGGDRTVSITLPGTEDNFDDLIIDNGLLTVTGRNENSAEVFIRYGDLPLVDVMQPLNLDVTDAGTNSRIEFDVSGFSSTAGADPPLLVVTVLGPDANEPGSVASVSAGRELGGDGLIAIPFAEFADPTGSGAAVDFTNVFSVWLRIIGGDTGELSYSFGPISFTTDTAASGTPAALPFSPGMRVLWFGNSHSGYNDIPNPLTVDRGVPEMFEFLSIEAGFDRPDITTGLVGGAFLNDHWNGRRAEAFDALALDERWTHFVMQGNSTEPTIPIGNPNLFLQRAQQLYAFTAATSPDVTGVYFQTHARNANHPNYFSAFENPAEYHEQVRVNYRIASSLVNQTYGAGATVLAPVGDAFAAVNWDDDMYVVPPIANDFNHMSPLGGLTTALIFYATIHDDQDLSLLDSVDFDAAEPSELVERLTDPALGLTEADFLEAKQRALAALNRCLGDYNGDFIADAFDGTSFFTELADGLPTLDLVAPFGVTDQADIAELITRLNTPCP
ncbi:MAG: hypothetical protein AAGI30_03420 [Planctomycetota bacterium]